MTNLPRLFSTEPFGPPELHPERMTWSVSSMRCFRACPRKFFWRYIMRLRPKVRSLGLMVGAHFHNALEWWYIHRRANPAKAFAKVATALEEEATAAQEYYDEEEYAKLVLAVQSFRGMVEGYTDVYADDRKRYRPILVEKEFRVPFTDFDFVGKIDLLAALSKSSQSHLVDHKTASNVNTSYIERLGLDLQMRGYIFGVTVGLNQPVTHVVYNVVKRCKLRRKSNEAIPDFADRVRLDYGSRPDFYFHREILRYSRADIEAFQHEAELVHADFEACRARIHEGPRLHAPYGFPINDRTCTAYFRLCEYFPLCSQGLDKGTALMYRQSEAYHEELSEEGD